MVHIDDLYPKGPEDYDPNCCCAMCLDISIARGRRQEADMYRQLRRDGKGKIARLVWSKRKQADAVFVEKLTHDLFYSDPSPSQPRSGLAALIDNG